jgi:hypothetical protein
MNYAWVAHIRFKQRTVNACEIRNTENYRATHEDYQGAKNLPGICRQWAVGIHDPA